MRFDTKALLKLMKQSWRGGGVKIQRTEYRGLWDSFFITGAGWALLIPKENCPGEIAGQIVTWLADMPKIGESKWVVKGCDPQDIPEDDRTIDISRHTTGNSETGMACLPLCTATDALIQYGADDRAAAFPLDAFAVVQAGANLGFLDTEAGIACWKDEDTQHKIAVWMRVCAGWADSQDMLIIRFGDQMNNVAVTDGDKVEAEQRMGYHVDYCPASELMEYHKNIKDTDVEALVATYFNEYDHDASLEDKSTEAYQKVWNAAKAELALRAILKAKGAKGKEAGGRTHA